METTLLSALPLLCLLGAFGYATAAGVRAYRATGKLSSLAIAITLVALMVGWLVNRFMPLARDMDDWVNYRGTLDPTITKGDRFLAIMSVDVSLLFVLTSLVSVLAILLLKADASDRSPPEKRSRQVSLIVAIAVTAVCLPARGKIAVYLAYLLAKAHLI